MRLSGPQFTIRQWLTVVVIAALLLVLLRMSLKSEAVAIFSVWFLSPLALSPVFMLLTPSRAQSLFKLEALTVLFVFAPCLVITISTGPADELGVAMIAIVGVWLTLACGYGYMVSIAWSRMIRGVTKEEVLARDEAAEFTVPPDGSLLSPRWQNSSGRSPWSA